MNNFNILQAAAGVAGSVLPDIFAGSPALDMSLTALSYAGSPALSEFGSILNSFNTDTAPLDNISVSATSAAAPSLSVGVNYPSESAGVSSILNNESSAEAGTSASASAVYGGAYGASSPYAEGVSGIAYSGALSPSETTIEQQSQSTAASVQNGTGEAGLSAQSDSNSDVSGVSAADNKNEISPSSTVSTVLTAMQNGYAPLGASAPGVINNNNSFNGNGAASESDTANSGGSGQTADNNSSYNADNLNGSSVIGKKDTKNAVYINTEGINGKSRADGKTSASSAENSAGLAGNKGKTESSSDINGNISGNSDTALADTKSGSAAGSANMSNGRALLSGKNTDGSNNTGSGNEKTDGKSADTSLSVPDNLSAANNASAAAGLKNVKSAGNADTNAGNNIAPSSISNSNSAGKAGSAGGANGGKSVENSIANAADIMAENVNANNNNNGSNDSSSSSSNIASLNKNGKDGNEKLNSINTINTGKNNNGKNSTNGSIYGDNSSSSSDSGQNNNVKMSDLAAYFLNGVTGSGKLSSDGSENGKLTLLDGKNAEFNDLLNGGLSQTSASLGSLNGGSAAGNGTTGSGANFSNELAASLNNDINSAAGGNISPASLTASTLSVMLKKNMQSAVITLKPASLGSIKINLSITGADGSGVNGLNKLIAVNILTQTNEAKNMLQSSSSNLTDALKNQGFTSINLNISSGFSNGGGNGAQSFADNYSADDGKNFASSVNRRYKNADGGSISGGAINRGGALPLMRGNSVIDYFV